MKTPITILNTLLIAFFLFTSFSFADEADAPLITKAVADELEAPLITKAVTNEAETSSITKAPLPEDADKLIQFALDKGGKKIDVLVNNEDFVPEAKGILDLTTEQFIDTVDRNLKTIWNTLAAIYPSVKAQTKINIVNIGSVAGAGGAPKLIDYASVKAGLYGLTKTVAKEWSRFGGVRCNLVNTGMINFPEGYEPQGAGKKGLKDFTKDALNPLTKGAITTPQEIANIVLFLSSDDSKAINATVVDAYGGLYTISGE